MVKKSNIVSSRCSTGIWGLDNLLAGGLPANRIYLIQGEPGTGKTTLAMQFLLEGVRSGETVLYITFSESKSELQAVAQSHGWDVSKVNMLELSAIEKQLHPDSLNTVFHPSEVEMSETTKLILAEVARVKPSRVVFDSVSEMRMLAEGSFRYRRQMLMFKQYFASSDATVILLDDLSTHREDLHVQSIVHGVIELTQLHPEFGDERRRLTIRKLRGIRFFGGFHDYVIRKGGLDVFPRMMSNDRSTEVPFNLVSSGIKKLDDLLDGGINQGTSTLVMGPAGTGKSTLAVQYAYAACERGERAMIFAFEESMHTLLARTEALGMNLKKHIKSGALEVRRVNPAELSPGEFADTIRRTVLEKDIKVVLIDSLNGYLHAMPEEEFLVLQLHELLSFLNNQGVVTMMVLAQQGMVGANMNAPVDLTYLADNVLITRYFEVLGRVKKAVSVLKKRGGSHETTLREFKISKRGIIVGEPLEQFQGVLTGVPHFVGSKEEILGYRDGENTK